MTNTNITEEDDKPLDPAMERLRRKMVRLLVISGLVIILGLMAVVVSIVYRVRNNSARQAVPPVLETVNAPASQSLLLPLGFSVESTAINGNHIVIVGTGADSVRKVFVHDYGTGKRVTEITIEQK